MADYRQTLTLTLQAPVLSQAVGALGFGFDMATLKDGKKGDNLVLPGSLVRGNLREALEHFAEVLERQGRADLAKALGGNIRDWFGQPGDGEVADGELKKNRARLHFDYYWRCPCPAGETTPRHRITLDPKTGTVKRGALVVIESPAASGQALTFTGDIKARFDNDEKAEQARFWLEKAALFLPALGSLKGVGFGKLLEAKLTLELVSDQPQTYSGSKDRIGLTLNLDRPFCIAKPRSAGANTFTGEDTIPGGVLKGAFAQGLEDVQSAIPGFDQLVFTHALPAKAEGLGRARVLPLSLAWAGDARTKDKDKRAIRENLVDLALLETACVRQTVKGFRAPKLQIDWKGDEDAAARELIATPPSCNRQLAVHTAIDKKTGQSEEDKLFSLDCVDPRYRDENGQTQTMLWCADIDLKGVAEDRRGKLVEALRQALARPIGGIGKTKAATTTVKLGPAWLDAKKPAALHGGLYIITLQTPALLFDDQQARTLPASGGADGLHKVYADYWRGLSCGKLELLRYFAAQQRVGGHFLWHRYRKEQTYRPFWLTVAGSVFVLKASQPVDSLLDEWRRRGLPLPGGGDSAALWDENPYIRENGYGEIRVNDSVHVEFQAEAGEWV